MGANILDKASNVLYMVGHDNLDTRRALPARAHTCLSKGNAPSLIEWQSGQGINAEGTNEMAVCTARPWLYSSAVALLDWIMSHYSHNLRARASCLPFAP